MNETAITLVGNLTDEPELRFTASGAAVVKFRIASTPRFFDKATGQFKDGDPLFLPCQAWRDQAEHVAESLTRGMRVIVVGRLRQRSYETREGEKRTVFEVEIDEVGPALRYATAAVTKAGRSGSGRTATASAPTRTPEPEDPWASTPAQSRTARSVVGEPGDFDDEPPF